MLIQRAYKFRLEPNREQTEKLFQFSGCARYVWNKALAIQKELLKETGKRKSFADMCKLLTGWKNEETTLWLKDAPVHALQQSLKNLDKAYSNYFNPKLVAKEPVFKKKGIYNSFKESDSKCFSTKDNKIKLPKLGEIKFRKSREIKGIPKNVTVTMKGKHWFVSVQTEKEVNIAERELTSSVGIDLGIKKFVALSDETDIKPLNSFKKLENKLAKEQRKLARKQKKSNRWKKQKAKISDIHIKIANVRNDFLHKNSTVISKNHALIVVEDLKVSNMSKSEKGTLENPGKNVKAKSGLNKAILDQGWSTFKNMLEYKQLWNGGLLLKVPPQNTSRECSKCGYISKENRKTQAKFKCMDPECNHEENADTNAAKVIKAAGLAVLARGDISRVNG